MCNKLLLQIIGLHFHLIAIPKKITTGDGSSGIQTSLDYSCWIKDLFLNILFGFCNTGNYLVYSVSPI